MSNVYVMELKESIIASGYPMYEQQVIDMKKINISEKDLKRANQLGKSKQGSGHDCFSKGIIIQMDLQNGQNICGGQWDRYHHMIMCLVKVKCIDYLNLILMICVINMLIKYNKFSK
ncbi:hypothetical protein RHK18_20120 [Clostridioides difficile]|nr:hypothetical protein [Clostridioides difficile]